MGTYVNGTKVAVISGLVYNPIYAEITDNHINEVLGYDASDGVRSVQQYFDIENMNEYFVSYDGSLKFVLNRPVIYRVDQVISEPDIDNPDILVENTDYWVDLVTGIVNISADFELIKGQRALRIDYRWGFVNNNYPEILNNYADLYCAMLHELFKSSAKNSDGAVLKEVEVGRYRELYDTSNLSIKTKYEPLLRTLLTNIESKYKLWE
jgi:hypothetical protein